ncbi:MAG: aminotransferase class V-fold PLP-dependent enzyme [Planctomycetota bacterium]|nr:aminotransferase class V-fold PLP-dependent enzyme [Planctomycetota bacterium]
MPASPIYLDNHATTAVDPRVLAAMLPYFTEVFGNAGSTTHSFGHEAKDAVNSARRSIATSIGADEHEIVFTSGATESNNLAIRGVAERERRRGNHLISVTTEHKAVLDPLASLAKHGFEVTLLPVAQHGSPHAGLLDVQRLADAIRPDTALVSVMLANNEIGVIQPLAEIGRLCKERGVLLHCDATQAVGKIPVDVNDLQVDLLSFTAHKIYGPKGVGALYVRRRNPIVRLQSQIDGGGQEHGLRSGTLNVPGIVGFAKALRLCLEEMPTESMRLAALRQRLYDGLAKSLSDVLLNGPVLSDPILRLPGNLNVTFGHVQGEAICLQIPDIAVSSGSACTSANPAPSHVLLALGLSEDQTKSSLRFGIGRFNTAEQIDYTIEAITAGVTRLRKLA